MLESCLGKPPVRVLVDRLKQVRSAVAESIGVDVERRVDEMRMSDG